MITTKQCSQCEETKDISNFSKAKKHKDGLGYKCKDCANARRKEYYRTKDGLITQIYGHQKASSKIRGNRPPEYSKESLKEWLFSQILFHELHEEWIQSGYKKRLSPSVDRLNDYIHYCFNNIQLMTWGENKDKGHRDRRNGINNKRNRAVLQFTKEGEFINEYHSASEASRRTGVSISPISKCCREKLPYSAGFKWRYKA